MLAAMLTEGDLAGSDKIARDSLLEGALLTPCYPL